jgi:extradiol dioxygenase family protein
MTRPRARFHLAFPVVDLARTRAFYGELLECPEGRSSERWIDFDFWGNQITAHLCLEGNATAAATPVDGDAVPVRHFGAILEPHDFEALRRRLDAAAVVFRIAPRVRFRGAVGEQQTMFVDDPSGNTLEFKSFAEDAAIFAR